MKYTAFSLGVSEWHKPSGVSLDETEIPWMPTSASEGIFEATASNR